MTDFTIFSDTGDLEAFKQTMSKDGDAFSAYLPTADQSVTATVWTKITISAENFDLNSKYDAATNYRWTPEAGYYQINWCATMSGTGTSLLSGNTGIYKNGSLYKYGNYYNGPAIATWISNGSELCYANGTDYFELWVNCNATSPLITFGDLATYFSGCLLRRP